MMANKAKHRGLRLERVLGLTALHSHGADVNPATGDVAFPAGCIVVIYSPTKNKQVAFMRASKTISCLRYSVDGGLLAVGERGHKPAVTVWDIARHRRLAELKEHRFGISAMAFSPGGGLLVSVGFLHDHNLIVWDWAKGVKLSAHRLAGKVHAVDFAASGSVFATVGEAHVRFWELGGRFSDSTASPFKVTEHRGVLMPAYKKATFVDVRCGRGRAAGTMLAVTSCGLLVSFGPKRLMEKWVELDTPRAFSLALADGVLACGCLDGVVRLFDPVTLEYLATLPQPPSLSDSTVDSTASSVGAASAPKAAALCVRLSSDGSRVVAIYDDRSLFVWDVRDRSNVGKFRSFLHHSACVWGVVAVPAVSARSVPKEDESLSAGLPDNAFITCSADNTVRVWHLGKGRGAEDAKRKVWGSLYSREMLRLIRTGDAVSGSVSGVKRYDTEIPEKPDRTTGLRCVAISPDCRHVASGDKRGNIRVHDVQTAKLVAFKEAHDSEVLCLQYSPSSVKDKAGKPSTELLVSGSRDRLVHVYGAPSYDELQTLDNHSAAVTALRFSVDGRRLFSCGGDRTVVMSSVLEHSAAEKNGSKGDGPVQRYRSVTTPGTIYDMDVDATNKYLATAGQDKRINLWSLATGKPIRSYKPEDECGELHAIRVDSAGMFAATCSFDKCIRLYDFYSGECVAKAAGHSELVTGLAFTPDCKRLVTSSSDGCVFVWKLAPELTLAMRDRLKELDATRLARKKAAAASEEDRPVGLPKRVAAAAESSSRPAIVVSSSSLEALRVHPPPSPESLSSPSRRKLTAVSPRAGSREKDREALHGILDNTDVGDAQVTESPSEVAGPSQEEQRPEFLTAKLPAWARTKGCSQDKATLPNGAVPGNESTSTNGVGSRWAERMAGDGVSLATFDLCPATADDGVVVDELTSSMTIEENDQVVVTGPAEDEGLIGDEEDDEDEEGEEEETVFFASMADKVGQSFEVTHKPSAFDAANDSAEEGTDERIVDELTQADESTEKKSAENPVAELFGGEDLAEGNDQGNVLRRSLSSSFRAERRRRSGEEDETEDRAAAMQPHKAEIGTLDQSYMTVASVSTTPRSPPQPLGPTKTLAQEREALKLRQRQEDTANAVDRMRLRLREMGILNKTKGKEKESQEDSAADKEHPTTAVGKGSADAESNSNLTNEASIELPPPKMDSAMPNASIGGSSLAEKSSERPTSQCLPVSNPAVPPPPPPTQFAETSSDKSNSKIVAAVAVQQAPARNFSPASPVSATPPRRHRGEHRNSVELRLRTAADARTACESSLRQLRTAFENTLNVLHSVQDLELTVSRASLAKVPMTAAGDATLVTVPDDVSFEECSLREVSGVVHALRSELGGFKRELENVIGTKEGGTSGNEDGSRANNRPDVNASTVSDGSLQASMDASLLGELREEQRRMMEMMNSLLVAQQKNENKGL